jgi:hypothetical protein
LGKFWNKGLEFFGAAEKFWGNYFLEKFFERQGLLGGNFLEGNGGGWQE